MTASTEKVMRGRDLRMARLQAKVGQLELSSRAAINHRTLMDIERERLEVSQQEMARLLRLLHDGKRNGERGDE